MISVVYGGIGPDCATDECDDFIHYWDLGTREQQSVSKPFYTYFSDKISSNDAIIRDNNPLMMGGSDSKVGAAAPYFGGNSYLEVDFKEIKGNDFSINMWVKPDCDDCALAGYNPEKDDGFYFGIDQNSRLTCMLLGDYKNNVITTTKSLSTSVWYHLSCKFSDGNLEVYVNGKLGGSTTPEHTNSNLKTEIVPLISKDAKSYVGYDGSASKFNLDELIVTLNGDSNEVNELYKLGITPQMTKFNNERTRSLFRKHGDLGKVIGLNLINEEKRIQIKFNDEINTEDAPIDDATVIGKGFLSFNLDKLDASFASSEAELKIGTSGCSDYKIYYSSDIEQGFEAIKDKGVCPDHICLDRDCNTVNGLSEVSFKINSFSSYGAEGSAPPANHAIYLGAGSNFSDINDNAIYLNSTGADGVYINDSHHLQMARNIINTSGDNSSAIFIRDSSGSEFKDNMLTTTGSGSAGVLFSSDSDPLKTYFNWFENNIIETNDYSFIGPELGVNNRFFYHNNESTSAIFWEITSVNTTFDFIWDNLFFEPNLVGLPNDPGLMDFNSTAMVGFYNLSYPQQPFLLKDGTRCDDTDACNISLWNETSGQLRAVVAGFSNYTTEAGVPSYNLTVFIDGVEGNEFDKTAKPFIVDIYVNDTYGNPVENVSVMIQEVNSNNLNDLGQLIPGSEILQSITIKTNFTGYASEVFIPTKKSTPNYQLFIKLLTDDGELINSKELTTSDTLGAGSSSFPDIGYLQNNNANVLTIVNNLFFWASEGKYNPIDFNVYQDTGIVENLTSPIVYPGSIVGANVSLYDTNGGSMMPGYIVVKETDSNILLNLGTAPGQSYSDGGAGSVVNDHLSELNNISATSERFYFTSTRKSTNSQNLSLEVYNSSDDLVAVIDLTESNTLGSISGGENTLEPSVNSIISNGLGNILSIENNVFTYLKDSS